MITDHVRPGPQPRRPRGSVISPLLANVSLHYVIDLWTERWRRRDAKDDMIVVRYADDVVVGSSIRNQAVFSLQFVYQPR